MLGFAINTIFLAVASVVYCWRTNRYMDPSYLYWPYRIVYLLEDRLTTHFLNLFIRFRLPWDQTTIFGYFGTILFSTICADVYLFMNGSILLLFVSICLHHQAFSQIVHDLAIQLDAQKSTNDARAMICNLIEFHLSVKR